MRTRRVRRSSRKDALGFADCEVSSTTVFFGYRPQRSKKCRHRVPRRLRQTKEPYLVYGSFIFVVVRDENEKSSPKQPQRHVRLCGL